MALASGTRLGAYQIVAPLGAGGMGEVYRARDGKLNRDVAVKVLSDLVAGDPDRLARFRREAQVLASLNHPNIGAIYGFEDSASTHALVLELVEGPTLADRIALGPIPIAEALSIANQIALALEAAHEQGIIHRDLKPANIKVRDDGTVKVLDFGLAKALDANASSAAAGAMNSPTLTAHATQMGVILGTAAYMAPEQARGKSVDRRVDVWAFGVVLYEMLTGRRAFQGDEMSDVLAAVLKETLPLDTVPAGTPEPIRRLLRRCLDKDRRERLADMSAVRLEIKEALAAGESPAPRDAPVGRRRSPVFAPAAVTGALVLAVLTGAAAWWLKPPPAQPARTVAQFAVTLAPTWSRLGRHSIAVSPDGTRVAYIAASKLYIRTLDQLEATALSSVADPSEVFFSPDGEWVGFFANSRLQKAAVTGGAPIPVCEATIPLGASWSGDTIVFGQEKGIYRVAAGGGTPDLVVARQSTERLANPRLLPGGRALLYTRNPVGSTWNDAEIVVEELATHSRTVLWRGGTDGQVLENGLLVYSRSGEILGLSLDLGALEIAGTPVSLVRGVQESTADTGAVQYGVSSAGTLVYISGSNLETNELAWVDLKGGVQPVTPDRANYQYPRVSRDGSKIAYTATVGGNVDVFVLEWARSAKFRLTTSTGADVAPVWSPDGKRIAYASTKDGGQNVYWQAADRSGAEERLTTGANLQYPYAWTKDGQTLLYIELDPKASYDIYALPVAGDRKPRPLVATTFDERRPALSPDGRWLAYQSNELGPFEVHVRPYPDVTRERHQVSAGGGDSPLWAPDGRAIYYRLGSKILRVPVTTTPDFKVMGKAEQVTDAMADIAGMAHDLAPDGKRFVVVKASGQAGAGAEYRVVLNWLEDVKARVAPRAR